MGENPDMDNGVGRVGRVVGHFLGQMHPAGENNVSLIPLGVVFRKQGVGGRRHDCVNSPGRAGASETAVDPDQEEVRSRGAAGARTKRTSMRFSVDK